MICKKRFAMIYSETTKYTLMHKNEKVADITLSEDGGLILGAGKIYEIERSPLLKTKIDIGELNDWWSRRAIPISRDGLKKALHILNIDSPKVLIKKSLGFSLSDQYWICPESETIKWEDVNFFQNGFSEDVGRALLGSEPLDKENIRLDSPDNASNGWLKKRWVTDGQNRILRKGASGIFQQEPFNEVIASNILDDLNIFHVKYTLCLNDEKPYSLCENFITPETEFVPAWHVNKIVPPNSEDNKFSHFLHCCDKLEIPNVKDVLNKMLTFDYIIYNEDRHYGNFGFIRNVQTLKFEGFAPIFDNGTALWYDTENVGIEKDVDSQPFATKHRKQIELVDDLSWFNSDALQRLEEIITDTFRDSKYVDADRAEKIYKITRNRVRDIERLQQEKMS